MRERERVRERYPKQLTLVQSVSDYWKERNGRKSDYWKGRNAVESPALSE